MAKVTITRAAGATTLQLGAFAQIAAKRRYGLEALKSDDPEVLLFAVFVEEVGARSAIDPEDFDRWLEQVRSFDVVTEDETADPPPAESSEPSPDSPPTSASPLPL